MKKEKMNLYTADGWLNIEAIAALNCWLNVIIGKRQVGKTYGVLKYMHDHELKYMYVRRTDDELKFISTNDDFNPFLPLESAGYHLTIVKEGDHDYSIGEYDYTNKGRRYITDKKAVGIDLLTMSKIRGFDGSAFTDIVYDEFIPVNMVIQRKAEGEGIIDGYTTVNGNRELFNKPPLRLWLLANANNMKNPTIEELKLLPIIEKLIRSQKEYIITDGIFVAMPKSQRIAEKRKETALMKHLSKYNSKYYQMAVEGIFSYNDVHLIRPLSVRGMSPILAVGDIVIYDNSSGLYCCSVKSVGVKSYPDTPEGLRKLQREYPEIRALYLEGAIYFDSVLSMQLFELYFSI